MKFESFRLHESYFSIVHKSGLQILIFPKKMTTAYAAVVARFGSVDRSFRTEDETEFTAVPAGTAHYLEHKLFDNPDGTDSFAAFSELGADANAFTTDTLTAYHFSTQSNFTAALETLLRMVLTPYFTKATVKKERGIIAEEIRAGKDSPFRRGASNLGKALYHVCPSRDDVAGTERSIAKITPEILYRCHAVFYQPSNLILSVCGDVTPDEVVAVVDKVLSTFPAPKKIIRAPFVEPPTAKKRRVTERMAAAKPICYLATKDPVLPDDPTDRLRRDAVATLLSEALFSTSSSFFTKQFEEGFLTTVYSHSYSGTDRFAFHVVCGECADAKEFSRRVWNYVEKIKREGIDPAAFERARRCLISDEIRSFDSTEEIGENLFLYATEGVGLSDYLPLLESVTIEDCRQLLNELFLPERSCLSVILPEAAE